MELSPVRRIECERAMAVRRRRDCRREEMRDAREVDECGARNVCSDSRGSSVGADEEVDREIRSM